MADGAMIGVRVNNITAGTVTTRYFHKDHLGSVATLTDEHGAVVQRLSCDPWGKQRNPGTLADDSSGILPTQDQTTRGFTGQEQLADVGLRRLPCLYIQCLYTQLSRVSSRRPKRSPNRNSISHGQCRPNSREQGFMGVHIAGNMICVPHRHLL